MTQGFSIGIDPGWGDKLNPLLGPWLEEILSPRRDIRWEVMPQPSRGVAEAGVIDRHDAIMALGMRFDESSFTGVRRLACISRWGVGFDTIDVPSATAADVLVALTPEAITRSVAEAQIALVFALAKRIPDLDRRTRAGRWRTGMPLLGIDVKGQALSSVGLGRIGSEMFRIAKGIGFGRLLAHDPYCPPSRAAGLGVELVDLDTAMAEGDFVTVNAFLGDGTRHLIGAPQFARMKPTAYFVNTARGPIVDEAALIGALRDGRIAGAGIDVFEIEPPSPDNPLLAMENVIVSPHGMAWTKQGMDGNSRDCCRNILQVATGEIPACLADDTAALRPGVQAKLARWRQL